MIDNCEFWYGWTFLGKRYRAVETEPGIVTYYATDRDSDHAPYKQIDTPFGLTNELVHLTQRLAQAEAALAAEKKKAEEAERQQTAFVDAALYEFGLSGDGLTDPGNLVLTKIRVTLRLLAEAEEAIRNLTADIDENQREYDRDGVLHGVEAKMVQADFELWKLKPAVKSALAREEKP